MFEVGQQVVCVDDHFDHPNRHGFHRPTKGDRYIVREFVPDFGGEPCIRLSEIINPPVVWRGDVFPEELAFKASRFRPIRKTDISIFTAMLNKAPEKERV